MQRFHAFNQFINTDEGKRRIIFRPVLNAAQQHARTVQFGGKCRSDGRCRGIAFLDDRSHGTGGVVTRARGNLRMIGEKAPALLDRDGMRCSRSHLSKF